MKLPHYASSLFTTFSVFSTFRQVSMQSFKENDESLCLIFAVFRHGQRAPVRFSPSDPNKPVWPSGLGSLTNVGKKQAYEYGKFLRQKYGHLLSETYVKDEIYVRSTDVDRCLMTAQCCLAGLYPPKRNDVWNEDIAWQPIPVHTSAQNLDPLNIKFIHVLTPPPGGYPEKRQRQAYKTLSENKDTMEALASEYENKEDISVILQLFNTYIIEATENLTPYSPPKLDLNITKATEIYNNIYDLLCQTSTHIVSASVYLLEDIKAKTSAKINGELPNQKAFLYSLHDISLTGCLAAFTDKLIRPNYTATILFELHKHPQAKDYYIKILYKNGPDETIEELPVNGSTLIPFDEFQKLIQEFAAKNKMWIDEDCN